MQDIFIENNHYSFWKKFILIASFFILTPIALFASTLSLFSLTSDASSVKGSSIENEISKESQQVSIFSSYENEIKSVSYEILEADAREVIIRNFLERNNSPLAPYSNLLIETSDKYGLDWRLLVAIAMKESGVCKAIPEDSHNCWGWGIHSQGTLMFSSYEEGIETVARGIKDKYVDEGLITVEQIMSKWIPHSPEGVWAVDVSTYIEKM